MIKTIQRTCVLFLKKELKERPCFSFLIFFVFILHGVFLIFSQIQPQNHLNPNRKKLVIKTHVLPQEFITTHKVLENHSSKKTSFSSQGRAEALPVKKKETNFQVKSQKKSAPNASTKPKQITTEKSKKLLHELQDSLSKIESSRENPSHTGAILIPQSIPALKADSYEIFSDKASEDVVFYQDILISYLKDALQLPAYGSVKISLTLSATGIPKELVVLSSDSEINRFYLEKHLKELSFPPFTAELAGKKEFTFSLNFCSN